MYTYLMTLIQCYFSVNTWRWKLRWCWIITKVIIWCHHQKPTSTCYIVTMLCARHDLDHPVFTRCGPFPGTGGKFVWEWNNLKRDFYLDGYTISNRIELIIWTICAFRVLNPHQWSLAKRNNFKSWKVLSQKCLNKLKPKLPTNLYGLF